MNRFNDPEDFKAADAVIKELERVPNNTITTIAELFAKVAPAWEADDLALADADFEVRKMARKKGISLITIEEFRENADVRVYDVPFRVYRK